MESLEKEQPTRTATIFEAIKNVAPSQLVAPELFGFQDLAGPFVEPLVKNL
tara:strand:+ start:76 stop:228 length:153 start_codon:yes stop_codon:yes gene_type:complete